MLPQSLEGLRSSCTVWTQNDSDSEGNRDQKMEQDESRWMRGKVLELHRQGRYQEAPETVLRARSRLPEKAGEVSYWRGDIGVYQRILLTL